MGKPDRITVFLEDGMLAAARAGRHNFLSLLQIMLKSRGLVADFQPKEKQPLFTAAHSLSHMKGPIGPNALIFRRAFEYPFWHIDTTEKRWDWTIAKAHFDFEGIPKARAAAFVDRQRKRLYGGAAEGADHILIPLQGKLTQKRSFQSASPVQMVEDTCLAYPDMKILATLHPHERYKAEDLSAIKNLENQFANLSVHNGSTIDLIRSCALVVSQNSGAAFTGYLFQKPAILYAKTDAHHIALGPQALGKIPEISEDTFNAYVYWYWQTMCINAGHPDCEAHILRDLRQSGWDI